MSTITGYDYFVSNKPIDCGKLTFICLRLNPFSQCATFPTSISR